MPYIKVHIMPEKSSAIPPSVKKWNKLLFGSPQIQQNEN
jgi:hypothetical protein